MSLLDVFMPNDLCARCDDAEPLLKYSLLATSHLGTARLSFCSRECLEAFRGGFFAVEAVGEEFLTEV